MAKSKPVAPGSRIETLDFMVNVMMAVHTDNGYKIVRVVEAFWDSETGEVFKIRARAYEGDPDTNGGFNGPPMTFSDRRTFVGACVGIVGDDNHTMIPVDGYVAQVMHERKTEAMNEPKPTDQPNPAATTAAITAAPTEATAAPGLELEDIGYFGDEDAIVETPESGEQFTGEEADESGTAHADAEPETAEDFEEVVEIDAGEVETAEPKTESESYWEMEPTESEEPVEPVEPAVETGKESEAASESEYAAESSETMPDDFAEPARPATLQPAAWFDTIPALSVDLDLCRMLGDKLRTKLAALLIKKPSLLVRDANDKSRPVKPVWFVTCPGSPKIILQFTGYGYPAGNEPIKATVLMLEGLSTAGTKLKNTRDDRHKIEAAVAFLVAAEEKAAKTPAPPPAKPTAAKKAPPVKAPPVIKKSPAVKPSPAAKAAVKPKAAAPKAKSAAKPKAAAPKAKAAAKPGAKPKLIITSPDYF